MKIFMNKKHQQIFLCIVMTAALLISLSCAVFADSPVDKAVTPVVEFINSLLTPILAIVGALGSLYCVFLGIKFAKAEEPQDREKAKAHLKNAIIGFVLIFVLMLALKLCMPALIDWVKSNGSTASGEID